MNDNLHDHLREHARDHYERVEVAEFWASVRRVADEVRTWDPARRAAARIAIVGTSTPPAESQGRATHR